MDDAAKTFERAVPILTVRTLDDDVIGFYARLGFAVSSRYPGYVILARGGVEVHLSAYPDHDPHTTAGSMYLRVADARSVYDDLRAGLERDGCLYRAPASGLTPELTAGLRARIAAGVPTVRLHDIEDKPWGQREFTVIDPGGNAIRVGSPVI